MHVSLSNKDMQGKCGLLLLLTTAEVSLRVSS